MSVLYKAHETAIIDPGATIGEGTKIWHWTHVCAGAIIGKHCTLSQNVFVSNKAIIGNNVKIQNNVSVYDSVLLEDDVFCGPSVVFTNVYNPRAAFSRKHEYQATIVKKGATLGANCTIVCGTVIGEHAFVAAGAVVNQSVPAFALVVGVPAQQIGWMSRFGEQLEFTENSNGVAYANCLKTGDQYMKKNDDTVVLLQKRNFE